MHRFRRLRAFVPTTRPPSRFLFYTNECVGLGHLRRTLTLADAATRRDDSASALIITGAPAALADERLSRIDIVKLPELSRGEEGGLRAARLGVDTSHLHDLRAHLAFAAAETFAPSVAVVDKTPLGLNDELVPTLHALRDKHTKIVLGLRDIEDEADAVKRRWDPSVRAAIAELYDAVLVYGPQGSTDALACLDWGDLDIPVHHVGYVGAPLPAHGGAPDLPPEYLLVTAGGGADGYPVFDAVLDALTVSPIHIPVVMVTGPLMPAEDRTLLERRGHELGVTVTPFRSDMTSVIVGATAVVAMAGYNTVSEIVRAGTPALLMPRTGPSREQVVRARALAEAGIASMVLPGSSSPAELASRLDAVLRRERTRVTDVAYDGADRAAEVICALADEAERSERRSRPRHAPGVPIHA